MDPRSTCFNRLWPMLPLLRILPSSWSYLDLLRILPSSWSYLGLVPSLLSHCHHEALSHWIRICYVSCWTWYLILTLSQVSSFHCIYACQDLESTTSQIHWSGFSHEWRWYHIGSVLAALAQATSSSTVSSTSLHLYQASAPFIWWRLSAYHWVFRQSLIVRHCQNSWPFLEAYRPSFAHYTIRCIAW